jgi:hypothetical protein
LFVVNCASPPFPDISDTIQIAHALFDQCDCDKNRCPTMIISN